MLMASSFILNHSERAQQWTLFPYVLASCNQPSTADQLRPVGPPLHAAHSVRLHSVSSMSACRGLDIASVSAPLHQL